MKNLKILSAILTTALILTLTFASCGGGGGGGGTPADNSGGSGGNKSPTSKIFESSDDKAIYILEVTSASAVNASVSRAAAPVYTPKTGDIFTLTIIIKTTGETWTDSGTVTTSGTTITLSGMNSLTVTVSGDGMTAITVPTGTTITFDSGITLTPTALTPKKVDPTVLEIYADKWDTGEDWAHGWDLIKEVTSIKPTKGDSFRFRIRGTLDKTLEKASLSISAHPADWSDYQWLGGAEQVRLLSGYIDQTFEINIGDNPISGWIIQLTLVNGVPLPKGAKNGDVLATISNFELRFMGVNLPDYKAYYDDWAVSAKNMNDAKKRTDFFGFEWVGNQENETFFPLSKYLDGNASVKIVNGNVVLNLGTPNPQALSSFPIDIRGGTVYPETSDNGERILSVISSFRTSDGKYSLIGPANFVYANKDNTKLTRTSYDDNNIPSTVTLTLKRGWNYVWWDEATQKNIVSTTQPRGRWLVLENDFFQ